jgi:hypothetical protein
MSSTSSSWWLEKRTAAPALCLAAENLGKQLDCDRVEARRTARRVRAAPARAAALPRVGRAAGCRGRALRPLRRAPGEAEPVDPPRCRDARRGVAQPVERPEVRKLLRAPASADRGHAPPACTRSAAARPARSAARPRAPRRCRLDHAEDGAHHCGLAGPVRAEKAEHPPARHRERAAVQRLHLAEPLAYVDDAKHCR